MIVSSDAAFGVWICVGGLVAVLYGLYLGGGSAGWFGCYDCYGCSDSGAVAFDLGTVVGACCVDSSYLGVYEFVWVFERLFADGEIYGAVDWRFVGACCWICGYSFCCVVYLS